MLIRSTLRAAPPALRTPSLQQHLLSRTSRRWASKQPVNSGHTVAKLEGVYDNPFNRERLAIKRHAAATAGTWPLWQQESCRQPEEYTLTRNSRHRLLAQAFHLVRPTTIQGRESELTTAFCSVVVPALILTGMNTWVQWCEHWEHQSHEPPINERPQYSYLHIRTKAFPWGDGDKVRG